MGQCVIVIDLFSMKLHMWARIDEDHNYKEKIFYFSNMKKWIKHYPMTGRLIITRGYMYHCQTQFFFICKSNNILYQVTSFIFHSHSETLHFFHYYQIKKLIKQFFFLDFGISGFFDNWFPLISYNVLPWISGFL